MIFIAHYKGGHSWIEIWSVKQGLIKFRSMCGHYSWTEVDLPFGPLLNYPSHYFFAWSVLQVIGCSPDLCILMADKSRGGFPHPPRIKSTSGLNEKKRIHLWLAWSCLDHVYLIPKGLLEKPIITVVVGTTTMFSAIIRVLYQLSSFTATHWPQEVHSLSHHSQNKLL